MRKRETDFFGTKFLVTTCVDLLTTEPILIPYKKGRSDKIINKIKQKIDQSDYDLSFLVEQKDKKEYITFMKIYTPIQRSGWAIHIGKTYSNNFLAELRYYEFSGKYRLKNATFSLGKIALNMISGGYSKGVVSNFVNLTGDIFKVFSTKNIPAILDDEYHRDSLIIFSGIMDIFNSEITNYLEK